MKGSSFIKPRHLAAALVASVAFMPFAAFAENTATVGGIVFANTRLVAVGRIPANQRDTFGEIFGSGSGMSIDPTGRRSGLQRLALAASRSRLQCRGNYGPPSASQHH